MATSYMNTKAFDAQDDTLDLECECGWKGKPADIGGEFYEALLDFECPKCDKILLIVDLIVDAEKYYNSKNKNK